MKEISDRRRQPVRYISAALIIVMLALILSGCQMLQLLAPVTREPDVFLEAEFALPVYDAPYPQFDTVEFGTVDENAWKSVLLNPFSTFAADVDTASYATVRRYLSGGELPPKDAVRVEELINYFHYDYPAPEPGDPFGVSLTLTDTPWNKETKLLVVGVQAEPLQTLRREPSNLVFLIDVSGSMDAPDKLGLVKQAFLMLTEHLTEDDTISIVTYAGFDRVLAEGVSGSEKTHLMSLIENLEAGGSTHGSAGIETAYEIAARYFDENRTNRVILATDGDLNIGVTSEGELTDLIREKKETGVYLSVMGFGLDNLKDNKLAALARNGNGNYGYIDSVLEARKHLIQDMGATLNTVANDVKFQVEFNPEMVKGYRLIGYEDRLLNPEDFADDKKDGGEIGAGHRVTIMYEIADHESGQIVPDVTGKYNKPTNAGESADDEILTVSIRYKEPNGDTSHLMQFPLESDAYNTERTENVELAAALAEFGMLLRRSEHSGTAGYDDVLDKLNGLENKDEYIQELIYLVTQAKRLTEYEPIDPESGIDEVEALQLARQYLLENEPDLVLEIDMNQSRIEMLDDDNWDAYADAFMPLDGISEETLSIGDFIVTIGDYVDHDFRILVVSRTDASVIGFIPIR